MKRIRLCLAAILLLFVSCEKNCLERRPKDVKPIDWGNYNDVHTVFWNTYGTCSNFNIYYNKNVMVYGWVKKKSEHGFMLVPDTYDSDKSYRLIGKPNLNVYGLGLLTDSCDLSKKCYVKGRLGYSPINKGLCCIAMPEIIIEDINDIYFE